LFIATLPAFVYQSDLFSQGPNASKPIAYPAATPKALSTINSESYRSAVVAVTGVCVWAPMWANVIRALLPAVRIYFIPHTAKAFADAAKFF